MDRFATLGGFTKASATTVFSRTLKKVMSEASTTPQSNKKPLGRKRKDGMCLPNMPVGITS